MSLFRQIWLAVIASTVIAFAGSFLASMLTARHYLEQQLAIKNNDADGLGLKREGDKAGHTASTIFRNAAQAGGGRS